MAIPKTLVLGLGNTILGDDGVGICVVREMRRTWTPGAGVELVEASLGGMVLLDLIAGYDHAVIVDAIMTQDDKPAGFIYELALDDLGELVVPYASHALDLKTTMGVGQQAGLQDAGDGEDLRNKDRGEHDLPRGADASDRRGRASPGEADCGGA